MATTVTKPANTAAQPVNKTNGNSMDQKEKLTVETKMSKEERLKLKQTNFKRLATARTKTAVKKLNHLSQLGNKNSYAYTDEQLDKIFAAVDNAVRDMKQKFSAAGQEKDFVIDL